MAVAVWNPSLFVGRYPEFTAAQAANPSQFLAFFMEAGLYLSNCDNSPVCNVTTRLVLLNMLTAHIAFLAGVLNADGQPRPVGRISDASEGSVSAGFDWNAQTPGTGPWFAQTQYGTAFWQATSNLRSFRYIVPRGFRYGR